MRVYRVLSAAGQTRHPAYKAPSISRKWRWRAGAALVALALAAGGVLLWQKSWEPRLEAASPDRMALPLPDQPSIAVLPFANMSDDPKQEYFADGVTDDLITGLSQVSGLFVISRNSSFGYKGKAVVPKQVSEELGVRYVLEGSVQRSGDRLRINAQLIDALSGGHVWADRFDGSLADVFALQDQVTSTVADALALRLSGGALAASRNETAVPAAYDALLRGWECFRRGTSEDYVKAIPYFEQAIRLDPDYGRAYAALALVYQWIGAGDWHQGQARLDGNTLTQIERYLHDAEKHPTTTSHQAAGVLATGYGLYPKAIAEFSEAIALDPSDSWSYAYMARALTFAGRPAEATQHIRTAMRVDPHYPPIFLSFLGFAQFGLEQFEEAAISLEKVTKLDPNDSDAFLLLGATYGHLGRTQEAVSAIAAYDALGRQRGRPPVTATFAWGD